MKLRGGYAELIRRLHGVGGNLGSFYFFALLCLVYVFQPWDVFMVPNGCWSSKYFISVPGKEQEEEGKKKEGAKISKGIFPDPIHNF